MAYITPEDVRNFMWDRTVQDNDLIIDLAFSEEEILGAMYRAAREFIIVPPYVVQVTAEMLDGSTNIFLDAVAQQLYISELSRLMRNDIDYTAGGVSTNLVAKRINHLKELIKIHGDRFRQATQDIKVTINIHEAFGSF